MDLADDSKIARIGGRLDTSYDNSSFSLIAEAYKGKSGDSLVLFDPTPPYFTRVDEDQRISGGFLLGRWTRATNNDGELALQAYIDHADRDLFAYDEKSTTYDIDFQYRFPSIANQEIIVGAAYRLISIELPGSDFIDFGPPIGNDGLASAFVQNDISLLDGDLHIIAGAKIEHNERLIDKTDVLPTLRFSWQASDASTIWGSATKSVRTPAYSDFSVFIEGFGTGIPPNSTINPSFFPATFSFSGDPNARSEDVISYELGYRAQLQSDLSIDVAIYRNDYDDLLDSQILDTTCEPSGDPVANCLSFPTHISVNTGVSSGDSVDSQGIEIAAEWTPSDKLQFNAIYTYTDVDVDTSSSSANPSGASRYGQYSENMYSLRMDWITSQSTSLNLWASYVDEVETISIPDYWNLMARFAWQVNPDLELSIVGRNLLESEHPEFVSEVSDLVPAEIERSLTAELRWSF